MKNNDRDGQSARDKRGRRYVTLADLRYNKPARDIAG
jgi:hypothetical protein